MDKIQNTSIISKAENKLSSETLNDVSGANPQDVFVVADNIIKTYTVGSTSVPALKGLTFSAKKGEFVVIVGPSGAGKTTVLNIMGGMEYLTSGRLIVDGVCVETLDRKQLTLYRRHDIGFVFQFYNLMPNLTALENVELASELCHDSLPARQILEQVGLGERLNNFPAQLSGGEQQRVSIARAIAKKPKILLCDEPTGALDYETGKHILSILSDMCREYGTTVIVVTHNSALKDMADRVVYIKNGRTERCEINPTPKSIQEIEW